MGVGWSLSEFNLPGGLIRVGFSFTSGYFISRVSRYFPKNQLPQFPISAILLTSLLCMPYIGSEANIWNGLYDAVCIVILFPFIIAFCVSSRWEPSVGATKLFRLLGGISYPLYLIHYPFMYYFYHWVWQNKLSFSEVWHVALALVAGSVLLGYLSWRFYDVPVRRWLSRKCG